MAEPRALTLLTVAGVPIRLHASWVVLAAALTWSLAADFAERYPAAAYPDWAAGTHWGMAVVAAVGVFLSLVLHELGHALVGRRFGLRFRSITLFIFGGVAELKEEPPTPRAEFWMAVAGPAVSLALAGVGLLLTLFGQAAALPVPATAVLRDLAAINLALAAFNLVPAFPLDGGRVLRACLWAAGGDLRRATAVTARLGLAFGGAMVLLGFFAVLFDQFVAGAWWIILGWFLRLIARGSFEEAEVRALLAGESVARFMTRDVISVPPDLDVERLVADVLCPRHHALYPVSAGGRVLGYVTPQAVKRFPRGEWPRRHVADIMDTDLGALEIPSTTPAAETLARMRGSGQTRLLVVDDGALAGIVTLQDVEDFVRLKAELEAAGAGEPAG